MKSLILTAVLASLFIFSASAQDIKDARDEARNKIVQMSEENHDNIVFKKTDYGIFKDFGKLLRLRHSSRDFNDSAITNEELGSILFAAKGVNRKTAANDFTGYTVPSAMHINFIDLYVFTAKGIYKWNPDNNTLEIIKKKDLRKATGEQDFVANAAVNILMIADYSKAAKMKAKIPDNKMIQLASIEAGAISENIYLACASLGLGTVVRTSVDNESILDELKLDSKVHEIIAAQTIGHTYSVLR